MLNEVCLLTVAQVAMDKHMHSLQLQENKGKGDEVQSTLKLCLDVKSKVYWSVFKVFGVFLVVCALGCSDHGFYEVQAYT